MSDIFDSNRFDYDAYYPDFTCSEIQQLKSLLNNTLAELEEVRADYKYIATQLTERDKKNFYWDKHKKVTKKINKLAALQAKIKRNL